MAVTFKRKAQPSSDEVLAAVGLLPEAPREEIQPRVPQLFKGSEVVINHALYPWSKYHSKGDVGVVVQYCIAPASPFTTSPEWDLCEVSFGAGRKNALVHRWELDHYHPEKAIATKVVRH